MINKFYKQTILPRLCFVPYFVARIILSVISAAHWLAGSCRRNEADSHLCIEAGVRGWESIEFKELYQSACEYLPPENVHRLTVQSDQGYLKQIADILQAKPITHYLYDPRTDNSDVLLWRALWRSFRVAILLQKQGVVPIVVLTDLAVRAWRTQAAVVSSKSGLVVSFMSPQKVQPIFPHKRLIGPSLMPFSNETLNCLVNFANHDFQQTRNRCIRFTGSLYEPRTSFLNQLKVSLSRSGHEFEILGRVMGSTRVSDEEYWKRLSSAAIIITTADQMHQRGTDWTWIPHLVYRYLEVLAAGSLLMAPAVPGISRYFIPGVHFVPFTTVEDAAENARHYLDHPDEAKKIASAGHAKAVHLIRSNSFWLQIDTALGHATISP